jgi:hypothetical protein
MEIVVATWKLNNLEKFTYPARCSGECLPEIPTLGRMRQEEFEFETSLTNIMRFWCQ